MSILELSSVAVSVDSWRTFELRPSLPTTTSAYSRRRSPSSV
jgi:hypothetical protein